MKNPDCSCDPRRQSRSGLFRANGRRFDEMLDQFGQCGASVGVACAPCEAQRVAVGQRKVVEVRALQERKRDVGERCCAHSRLKHLRGLQVGRAAYGDVHLDTGFCGHAIHKAPHVAAHGERHRDGVHDRRDAFWLSPRKRLGNQQCVPDLAENRIFEPRPERVLANETNVVDALADCGDHFPGLLMVDFKPDAAARFPERFQPRQNQPCGDAVGGDHPHCPRCSTAPGGVVGKPLEILTSHGGEFPPRIGQLQSAPASPDEFYAEEGFQFADLPADERLADRVAFGGADNGAGVRDCAEISEAFHGETGLGDDVLIHDCGVMLPIFNALCKFSLPA